MRMKVVVFASFFCSSLLGGLLLRGNCPGVCSLQCEEVYCARIANAQQGAFWQCSKFANGQCRLNGNLNPCDPPGGTCTEGSSWNAWWKCPSCLDQCPPNANTAAEATECGPIQTPGCSPGVDCCSPQENTKRWACVTGT